MLTPARPKASPISARAPGRSSRTMVKSFMAPPAPESLQTAGFCCASFLHFFDLLERDCLGAAAAVNLSGDLYQLADPGQKLRAHVDIGHPGGDGVIDALILG